MRARKAIQLSELSGTHWEEVGLSAGNTKPMSLARLTCFPQIALFNSYMLAYSDPL